MPDQGNSHQPTENPEEYIPPAIYQHCVTVYDAMAEEAESKRLEDTDATGIVWTGFTTKLFQRLGLAVPYYSQCTRLLKSMDCIRQLRRGGGGSPSQWLLMQEPTIELYQAVAGDILPASKRTQDQEIVDQRMRDLARRVEELESQNG